MRGRIQYPEWVKHGAIGCLGFVTAFACCGATNDLPGMVLHFTLDETKNGAFVDLVTSNAIGRVTNAHTMPQGKLGGACEFAAKGSFIQVADAPALNPKQITVALWFKTSKEAWAPRTLIEKGMERGYALVIAGGGKENPRKGRLRAAVAGRDIFSDTTVNDGVWHHAAATYDGETLKLYVDGALQKQTAAGHGELAATTHELTLGMNRSSPMGQAKEVALDGLLDEVAIFDRALNAAEVKQLIASAKPKFTKQQVERRLKELKDLLDRGLILKEFYDRKVDECQVDE